MTAKCRSCNKGTLKETERDDTYVYLVCPICDQPADTTVKNWNQHGIHDGYITYQMPYMKDLEFSKEKKK